VIGATTRVLDQSGPLLVCWSAFSTQRCWSDLAAEEADADHERLHREVEPVDQRGQNMSAAP
jgi:hypothetical protein